MICVILASGSESKLYPITRNIPKPLLKIKDKTILDWLIDDIDSSKKVSRYVLVSDKEYEQKFMEWSRTREQNIMVIGESGLSDPNCPSGVRSLQRTVDALYLDEDLLIVHADSLFECSISDFIEYAINKGTSCITRYYEKRMMVVQSSYALNVSSKDEVIDVLYKPFRSKTHWCIAPIYYVKRMDIPYISGKAIVDDDLGGLGNFVSWLFENENIYAYEMKGKKYEISNLNSYEKIKKEFEPAAFNTAKTSE